MSTESIIVIGEVPYIFFGRLHDSSLCFQDPNGGKSFQLCPGIFGKPSTFGTGGSFAAFNSCAGEPVLQQLNLVALERIALV